MDSSRHARRSGSRGGGPNDQHSCNAQHRRRVETWDSRTALGTHGEPGDSGRMVGNPEVILAPLGGGHLDV